MKVNPVVRTLIIFLTLCCNIGCDQISKNIVRKNVLFEEQISIFGNYVTLTKIENSGAFLSLGDSLPTPVKTLLLSILPVIVLVVATYYLLTKKNLSTTTLMAICFVVGGGIGNIADRIIYGSVTDFLHIDFIIFQTGIFNLADVSIMTGMFLILVDSYLSRTKNIFETVDNESDD
jgi:signal peptidase II